VKISRKIQSAIILLVIFMPLAACTTSSHTAIPTPKVADISLISDPACEASCWQSLTLGKSTKDEVLAFLNANALTAGNFQPSAPDTLGIRWWWAGKEKELERSNLFNFHSNVLTEIHLKPNTDIPLKKVIEVNGLPEKLIIAARCYDNFGIPGYDLKLFYPKRGVVVAWAYDDSNLPDCPPPVTVCPSPDQPASSIDYYTLDIVQSLSDQNPVGLGNNFGTGVYAGNDLARLENGEWVVNCLRINTQ
jgi:hypothetical protein